MNKLTISKRFILTSGVLLLLTTLLAAIALFSFNTVSGDATTLATDTFPGFATSSSMESDVAEIRVAQLRWLLATDEVEEKKWADTVVANRQHLDQNMQTYQAFINGDPVDQANFDKLKPSLAALDASWQKVLNINGLTQHVEAFQIQRTECLPNLLALKDEVATIVEFNKQATLENIASTTHTVHSSSWLTMLVALIALVLGTGISWFMIRTLTQQLTIMVSDLAEGSDQVSSASTQVSASSHHLADDVSQQAAMIEESSAAAEQINSMAQRNTEGARTASDLVHQAVTSTEQTNRAVADCVDAMNAIGESSSKIAKTLQVIDKIAFQTNILALNAAVEAARAGEAGMGFAVVAEEVRNLAQRCAAASEEISALIEQSVGNSDTGRARMATLVQSGEKVNQIFTTMRGLVQEITHGSEEQTRGTDQISRSIQKMEQGTQKTAAAAEEGAAAAQELNSQSEQLREVAVSLGRLAGIAGSSNTRSRSAHSTPNPSQPYRITPASRPTSYSKPAPASAPASVSSFSPNSSSNDDTDFTEF